MCFTVHTAINLTIKKGEIAFLGEDFFIEFNAPYTERMNIWIARLKPDPNFPIVQNCCNIEH